MNFRDKICIESELMIIFLQIKLNKTMNKSILGYKINVNNVTSLFICFYTFVN